jgi:hypothetical protein
MANADLSGRLSQVPRQRVDEHRSYWLRGYRGVLGFACLTLIPVG